RQRIEQKLTQQLQRRHQRQMEMIQRERQRLRRLEGQIRQQMERSQELIQLQTEAALDRILSAGGLAELDEPGDDFGHFEGEADRVRGRKNEYEQARSEMLRNQYASLWAQYERQKAEIDELRQMMEQTANRRDKELLRANLELQRQRQSALQETTRAISDELTSQLRASRDKLENPPADRHPETLQKINQQLAEVESQIAKATAEVKLNEATLKKLAAEMKHEESDQHIPDRLVRSYLIRQHSSRSRLDELLLLIDDLRIQRRELQKQQDKLRQRDDDGKTQTADDVSNDLDDLFGGR
ncbi:MAG: hypothetical protein KDA87_25510, partial [Planctomycetales bacterium]|nr:hypothetical protein [Planctomycetales bacterium]